MTRIFDNRVHCDDEPDFVVNFDFKFGTSTQAGIDD